MGFYVGFHRSLSLMSISLSEYIRVYQGLSGSIRVYHGCTSTFNDNSCALIYDIDIYIYIWNEESLGTMRLKPEPKFALDKQSARRGFDDHAGIFLAL